MKKSEKTGLILMSITTICLGVMVLLSIKDKREYLINARSYQIEIVDDSIKLYDVDRLVGTIKSEGKLDSIIIKDNK